MTDAPEGQWLLLIHQIPPKPDYFRVKIRRRLQRLGTVALKNTVYVLPNTEQAQEDFQWVVREIVEGGGEALLCKASFLEGLTDEGVKALFQSARDAEYTQLAEDLRHLIERLPPDLSIDDEQRAQITLETTRLRRRFEEVVAIDFFRAPNREMVEGLLMGLETRLRASTLAISALENSERSFRNYQGCTWVTRPGVHVDRIASAWLIRRFVDPEARFKFVSSSRYAPSQGEVRFDMFEAEFTHEGDRCTFEVLLERLNLDDQALRHIAEIVHDIDLKDGKFQRAEATGVGLLVTGITMAHQNDEERLARGAAVFDDLYAYFQRKQG